MTHAPLLLKATHASPNPALGIVRVDVECGTCGAPLSIGRDGLFLKDSMCPGVGGPRHGVDSDIANSLLSGMRL